MDEDQRPGSSDRRFAQQQETYTYAHHSRFQSLFFRTAFVAKKRIHARHCTIRDSYSELIAENVPVDSDLADASHRDAMAVAATIANRSQMDRRHAVGWLAI